MVAVPTIAPATPQPTATARAGDVILDEPSYKKVSITKHITHITQPNTHKMQQLMCFDILQQICYQKSDIRMRWQGLDSCCKL